MVLYFGVEMVKL